MLERDHDVALLLAAAARLSAESTVVLVSGEAGIGKSTLVDAFVAGLDGGARVLRGWCDNLVTANPLGPIREAVRGRPGSLVASPELDAALAVGDVPTVLAELHAAFALGRPTVMVIEDLHWADDATLDVLSYLARRLEHLRLLLVCSLRPEDSASMALRRFLGGLLTRATLRIEPQPLTRSAVAQLNARGQWDTDELWSVTGGNPFYVTEALAGQSGHGVPATVSDAVLSRLHRAGPAARRALEHLSVWSGELPHELAEAILGDDVHGLAEAEARGLVSADRDGVRFRHELARRATEGTLPSLQRRAIDQRIVTTLAATGEDLPRLLHHAIRCGDAAVVARYAPAAGAYSAQVGANREALAYFAAALEHEELMTTRSVAEVCDSYAWELHIAHRFDDAVTHGRRAARLWAELGDTQAEAAALRRLARELFMAAEPDEALASAERALELVAEGDAEARAAALGALGSHYALAGDARAVPLLEQARTLVGAGALPGTESLCLNYLATAREDLAPEQRLSLLWEALASGVREESFEATARAWTNLVELLHRYRRTAELSQAVASGLAFARTHGYWSHAYNLEVHRALALQTQGQWTTAAHALEAALAGYPDPGMLVTYSLAPYGRLLARRGDPRAEDMLRRCWTAALRMRFLTGLAFAGTGLVEWAWLSGRPEVAREVLDGWRPHATRPTAEVVDAEIRCYAARAGVVEDRPVAGADGWSLSLRGEWSAAAGWWEDHGDAYEAALAVCDSCDPQHLMDAVRTLDRLGADEAARVVRRRLAEHGVRAVPRGPARSTRVNPVGLTERQLEVVRLAGEGLTNTEIADRLFLSVRTVDHHVSAALAKLGVAGRREIAAALRALGV